MNENVEQNRCVCLRNIKFKNGMNYFKDLTYTCEINIDKVSVGYEDGRFTTMSKDIFDNHFQLKQKKPMSDYKEYPSDTMVRIKETGELGEAFESSLGYISVFIEGEDDCRFFKIEDVEFI